jgi:hypothetical protein
VGMAIEGKSLRVQSRFTQIQRGAIAPTDRLLKAYGKH